MELLIIRHKDFFMYIECTKFDDIWQKAVDNVGEAGLLSMYSWSDGVMSVERMLENGNTTEIAKDSVAPAVFFDNVDYPIWVEFCCEINSAQFGSVLKGDNERFSFRRNILAGFLNYGNEIGRSEICIIYQKGKHTHQFVFSFEVLSTKIDYHKHWHCILEDIEQEYRMLSLDYMRRTFHDFTPDPNGENSDIVWWNVFAKEHEKFVNACKGIIERPRHRLHSRSSYKQADQLTFVPVEIENELAEHRHEASHLYCVKEQRQTFDTQENRFLKFALSHITDKYELLKKRIEALNNVSEVKKAEIHNILEALIKMKRNPFFRTIGQYKGMNQESLVLQKAVGYSQIYRIWNVLRRGYSLQEGLYRLETKDIATLYEIWCFIEVSHIVKEKLGLNDDSVEHRNRMEMSGIFTWELGKGEHSRILFKKDGIELAELVYNPKNTDKKNNSVGLKNIVAPTVPQKPDIVLQLTKNDLLRGMKITYLFDAKYRIDGRSNGMEVPPEDAINQMHRYRDAIYYKDYDAGTLKKEVIGGYILFPGKGSPDYRDVAKFYKTIGEVNIGAFPLLPKDKHNRKLLEDFIGTLL